MDQMRLTRSLKLICGLSVGLYLVRIPLYGEFAFGYLNWNLILALLPLLFAWLLSYRLQSTRWLSGYNLLISLLWLGFLPNSFYIATDLIHVSEVMPHTMVYDAVMILSYTLAGLIMGYASVIIVHRELRARLSNRQADGIIVGAFLISSFAIYLGRYMRWNTWDVIVNPFGLLFNVIDSLVAPRPGAPVMTTTLLFFTFISVTYLAVLELAPLEVAKTLTKSGKRQADKK